MTILFQECGIYQVLPLILNGSTSAGATSSVSSLAAASPARNSSSGCSSPLETSSRAPSIAMLMMSGDCPPATWVVILFEYSDQVVTGVKLSLIVTLGYFCLKRAWASA